MLRCPTQGASDKGNEDTDATAVGGENEKTALNSPWRATEDDDAAERGSLASLLDKESEGETG